MKREHIDKVVILVVVSNSLDFFYEKPKIVLIRHICNINIVGKKIIDFLQTYYNIAFTKNFFLIIVLVSHFRSL